MNIYTKISGFGHFLPKKIYSNEDLKKIVDTSDEWIYSRTGIKQRHIAESDELTSNLAINAALSAFNNSKIDPKVIDCIIIATTTPDNTFPSTATKVQNFFQLKAVSDTHLTLPTIGCV